MHVYFLSLLALSNLLVMDTYSGLFFTSRLPTNNVMYTHSLLYIHAYT